MPNEPGQLFVAERDGVHESDTRRGISLYDSVIGHVNDDFFNVHTMLLVVMECHSDGGTAGTISHRPRANIGRTTSCLLVNPHVIASGWTTSYGSYSVLQNARPGDTLSFFPLIKKDDKPPPIKLAPLNSEPAVLSSLVKVIAVGETVMIVDDTPPFYPYLTT